MPVVVRPFASLLATTSVCVAVAAGACAPKEGTSAIGTSERPRGASREVRDGGAEGAVAADVLPKDYATTFRKLNAARFVSVGHAPGRWDVDVYANDVAASAVAASSRKMPVGAVFVEEHFERADGDARGPVMMMTKREPGYASEHGDWQWTVVGAGGQVAFDGVVESCAGCHDDAPSDGFFRVAPP